jgi:hypothetical protein
MFTAIGAFLAVLTVGITEAAEVRPGRGGPGDRLRKTTGKRPCLYFFRGRSKI